MKNESRRVAIERKKRIVRLASDYPGLGVSRNLHKSDFRSRTLHYSNTGDKSAAMNNREWVESRELKKENIRLRKEIRDMQEDLKILKAAINLLIKWGMIVAMYAYFLKKVF